MDYKQANESTDSRVKVKIDFDDTFPDDVKHSIVEMCRNVEYTSRRSKPNEIIALISSYDGKLFKCLAKIIDNGV